MSDDSITERYIKYRQGKTGRDPDVLEFDGDNVQLNVDLNSYGEQLNTEESNNETKNCNKKIANS